MLTMLLSLVAAAMMIQYPVLLWLLVGLSAVVLLAMLVLLGESTLHGVAHEAGASWDPLLRWLPPRLRQAWCLVPLGFLAFVVLNVALHWLLRP